MHNNDYYQRERSHLEDLLLSYMSTLIILSVLFGFLVLAMLIWMNIYIMIAVGGVFGVYGAITLNMMRTIKDITRLDLEEDAHNGE